MRVILTCGHWTAPAVSGSVVREGYRTHHWFAHRLRKAALTEEGEDIQRVNEKDSYKATTPDWKLQISYLPVKRELFWTLASKALVLLVLKLRPRKAAITWVRNIHLEKLHDLFPAGGNIIGGSDDERSAVTHTGCCSDLDNRIQPQLGYHNGSI